MSKDFDINDLEIEHPQEFCCPIGLTLMESPVLLIDDGHTYEQSEIEDWLKSNNRSPITNKTLQTKQFVINRALKYQIDQYLLKLKKSHSNNNQTNKSVELDVINNTNNNQYIQLKNKKISDKKRKISINHKTETQSIQPPLKKQRRNNIVQETNDTSAENTSDSLSIFGYNPMHLIATSSNWITQKWTQTLQNVSDKDQMENLRNVVQHAKDCKTAVDSTMEKISSVCDDILDNMESIAKEFEKRSDNNR